MADNVDSEFSWQSALNETFTDFTQQAINYFPQILATAGVLLIGWLAAHVLSLSTRKLILGLDALFGKITRIDNINRERIQTSYSLIISKAVFWIVMVFFLAVGANILGWEMFTGWLDRIVGYLPGLITGLAIILGGFLVSNLAKATIYTAAERAGITQSAGMARSVQIVIIFSSIIIGVEQIGLNIDFLSNIIVASVAILLAGAALAFSLGARNMVANIIGAQYTRKYCKVGDRIRIGELEGEIVELSQAFIVLETQLGQATIPAKYFHEQISIINTSSKV
jgi:hypothetical protein